MQPAFYQLEVEFCCTLATNNFSFFCTEIYRSYCIVVWGCKLGFFILFNSLFTVDFSVVITTYIDELKNS